MRTASKPHIGILFGGRSTEHEVSIASATTIFHAMDSALFVPIPIGIDHDGVWHVADAVPGPPPRDLFASGAAIPSHPALHDGLTLLRTRDGTPALATPLDAVFPIIHGRGGEDGSLQGLLELSEVPYVGSDVRSTALCMDKVLAKSVLRAAGIPTVPSLHATAHAIAIDTSVFVAEVERVFGYPVFVKPANTGSSVGVSKARSRSELGPALEEAAQYDLDILVERAIDAREIECAVLGGYDPLSSPMGEILIQGEFYDYAAKYSDDRTRLEIPADVSDALAARMQSLAIQSFRALRCWGMARVDFFVDRRTEEVFVNELNTHPGFTEVSMYPKLCEAAGVSLPDLVARLIDLAFERQRERSRLRTRYER